MNKRHLRASFHARARCRHKLCQWRGPARSSYNKPPAAQQADQDAGQHRTETGHPVEVDRWWSGFCRACQFGSGRCKTRPEAMGWLTVHSLNDPRHLRAEQEYAEWSRIADRVLAIAGLDITQGES